MVVLNPTPTKPIITINGPLVFCAGGGVTFTTPSVANTTYQWYNNGVAIGGATNNTYTAIQSGSYSLTATTVGGCSITTNEYRTNVVNSLSGTSLTNYNAATDNALVPITAAEYSSLVTNLAATKTSAYDATFGLAVSGGTNSRPLRNVAFGTYPGGQAMINGYVYAVKVKLGTGATSYNTGFTAGYGTTTTGAGIALSNNSSIGGTLDASGNAYFIIKNPTTLPNAGAYPTFYYPSSSTSYVSTNTTVGNVYIVPDASASGSNITSATTYTAWGPFLGLFQFLQQAPQYLNVTVNPLPTATITQGSSVTLTGGSTTLTAAAGTGTQTYLWYKNSNISGGTFTSTGVTSQTYTVTSVGQYKVVVTSAAGCSVTSDVSVISNVPGVGTNGATTFCQGGSVVLTTTLNGTTADNVKWIDRNNNDLVVGTGLTYSATTSGNYAATFYSGTNLITTNTVTVGTNATAPVLVTVNPLPTATITNGANASACAGQNITLTASTGASTPTYQWYLGGTALSSATYSSTSASLIAPTSGNYTVKITDGIGCSNTSSSTTVTINPTPATPSLSNAAATICNNASFDLTTIQPTAVSGITYEWHTASSNPVTGNLLISPIIAANTTAGTYTYYLFAKDNTTGCYSASGASFTLTINAVIPSVNITGSNQTYFVGDVANALSASASTGMTLQWWGQLVGGSTLSSPVIPATNSVGVTNYYVNQIDNNGSGCQSTPRQLVTVTVSPATPDISVNTGINGNTITYCQNATPVTLTASSIVGANLNWYTVPTGGAALASAPTPSTGTATTTSYYVSQTYNGLTSSRVQVIVVVNPTPATPGVITGTQNPSAGDLVNYSISNVQNATSYIWSLPSDWTGSSTINNIDASIGTANGYVKVAAVINGCTSSYQQLSVGLKPPSPNISGNTGINGNTITYCQGATPVQLLATGSNGASFNWYNSATGGTAVAIAPTPSTSTAGTVSYYVSQTVNGIESDRVQIDIVTNELPVISGTISGNSTPLNNTNQTYSITNIPGANFEWTVPGTWTISAGTNSPIISGNVASGIEVNSITTNVISSGTIQVIPTLNGCIGNTKILIIGIKPPLVDVTNVGPYIYCQGDVATTLNATPINGASLNWYTTSTGGAALQNAPTPSTSTGGTQNYYVSQTINGVESDRSLITVTVNAAPAVVSLVTTQPTCAVPTGTIVASSAPGVIGNLYSIDGGNSFTNNKIFTSLAAGTTYNIIQKDGNGCSSPIASSTLIAAPVVPSTPAITSSANAAVCSGGTVTLTANIGSVNYTPTYQWYTNVNGTSNPIGGANTASYTTLLSGDYSVEATNPVSGCVSGMSSISTVSIVAPSNAAISQINQLGTDNINCTAKPVLLSVSTNASSPSYQWQVLTNANTNTFANTGTPTISNAAQTGFDAQYETNVIGTFRVLVTDGYGCVKTSDPFVVQSVSTSPAISTICQGATTQLTANSTGLSGTFTYQWQISNTGVAGTYTNVASNGTSANYNAGVAGYYQVIVSNTYSGTTTNHTSCPAQVIVNALPTVSIAGYNANCAGSTTILTGVASSTVSITSYQWFNAGIIINGETNTTYSTSIAGIFDIKVIDANGCTATTNNNSTNNSLVFNALPALPVATATQPDCNTSTGSITVSSPGAGSFTYNIVSGSYSSTNNTGIFTGLTANNTYSITITNNSTGCTSPALNVFINPIPTPSTTPTVSVIDPTCSLATGTISITSLGANYSYSINGVNYQSSNVFTGLNSGGYSVTTKFNNGCASAATTATIAVQPITPQIPGIIAGNTSVNISASEVYSISLVNNATSYVWTLPSNTWTITSGINTTSISTTVGNVGGNITVAANNNGCISAPQTLAIVTKPTAPTVTNAIYCQGVTANSLSGNATASNGAILNWYTLPTGGTAAATAPTPSTGSAGTQNYYVSQTVNGIESDRALIVVTVNTAPTTLSVNITQPTCNVNTATISLTGGVANATYIINGGLYSNTTGSFINIPANATYSLTQKDPSTGCLSVAVSAIVNPALVPPTNPSFNITQPDCISATGKITITNNIGAGFNYSIDEIHYQTSPIFNGLVAGTYSVTVVNADGCLSNVVFATINPQPLPSQPLLNGSITPNSITICTGAATTLTASLTNSPTAGSNNTSLTYQWYKGGVIIPGAANATFNPTASGNYSVIATNTLGCTSAASGTVLVTLNPLPTATITGGAELAFADCTQTKIVLTANTNANSPTYQWQKLDVINNVYSNVGTPTSGTQNLTGVFSSFEVSVAGSYRVVIAENGCSTNSAVTKIVSAPAVNALALTTICQGATVNLTATGSFTSYQWQQNTGGGYVNIATNGTNPLLSVSNGGDYRVVATTGGVNSTSCPITITSNSLPVANPTIAPSSSICAGTPALLTSNTFGASPFTYQWNVDGNPIFNAISDTYSATIGGDYTVKVTDANGCESLSTVSTLTVNAVPSRPTAINGANVVIAGATQTYSITPVSGASSYTWTLPNGWTGTSITNSITTVVGSAGGNITVVANANGCTSPAQSLAVTMGSLTNDTATAYINLPIAGNIATNDVSAAGSTYAQPLQISGATITMNNDGTYTFTATAAGTYTYTIAVCATGQNSNCPTEILVITVPENTLTDDAATAYQNVPSSGNLSTNDNTPAGTTYGQPTALTGATIVVNGDGTYSFTATAAGTYTYTIPVCAPGQTTNCPSETLVITVPVNIVTDDAATAFQNIPTAGNLSTNDTVPAGTTYGQPAQLTGATITVNGDGTYTFTATAAGTYTYTVPVCAPGQTTSCPTETLVITVPVNTLLDDVAIAYQNIPSSGNLSTNDSTPIGTTYGQPAQITGATITVNGDGTYTFTATAAGTYTYTIPVCAPGQTTNCPTENLVITVPQNILVSDTAAAYLNIPKSGNISTNDVLPAGSTYGQPAQLTGATITVNGNGTYSFTATVAGTYTYTIPVCAPGQTMNCPTETLVIIVPKNNITPDVAVTNINVPVPGNLSINDNVPTGTNYGQPAANPTNPAGGVISVSPNGTYTFTATIPGKYTYYIPTCAPGQSTGCPLTPLVITVLDPTATNNKPVVNNDIATTPTGSSTTVNVLANDKAGNTGGTLNPSTVTIANSPAHGSATVNPTTGAVTYTPAAGYVGSDSLVYNVCDNATPVNCQTGVVYFTVTPATSPATTYANADFATIVSSPNGTNNVNGNVLINDKNTGGNTLTASLVSGPTSAQGTFSLNADGSYTFTPAPGFSGPVVITYKACDGSTPPVCAINTLEILVTPAPPINNTIINPDFGVTNISVPLSGNLNTNDNISTGTTYGQPAANASNPTGATITVNANGTYSFNATQPGTYTYYVPICAAGQTTGCPLSPLVITVVDPLSNTNAPIVNPDIATTIVNTPITTNVIANDKAANLGTSLNLSSLSIATAPKHGSVIVNADGTLTYTPANGFVGSDSLIYTICDNSTPTPICKSGVVYYTVNTATANPVTTAGDDFAKTYAGNPVAGNVLNNDKNTSGATLVVTANSTVPANKGVFLMNTNGTYTFTPAPGFTGPIEVTYTVCGGTPQVCTNATLHLLVEPLIPAKILEVTKIANSAKMNLDGSFNISFVLKIQNLTKDYIDSVLLKDDLSKVFTNTTGVKVSSVVVSGKLVKNNSYDGVQNIDLLSVQSALDPQKEDSVILNINVASSVSGNFLNTAIATAPTAYGLVSTISTDPTKLSSSTDTTRRPTQFMIPLIEVMIPPSFSPNSDGFNDAWIISRPAGTTITVKVFNRWGNEVYSSADYKNDWRGKGVNNILGEDLPEGTYYYVVETRDSNGTTRKFAGSLTLVR